MKQQIEMVDLGFSVADAEGIQFRHDGDDLLLEFVDWKESNISVRCENAIGFKYQIGEYFISDTERYDSCHIVKNSEWVKLLLSQGEAWDTEEWFHYKLNFNASGVVEVLCTKLTKT